jgi:signal transduction histidine kinase
MIEGLNMRMVFTRPTLAMLWLSAACLLTSMLAAWYLLQQPWLGVTLRVSDEGDKLLVAHLAPHLGQRMAMGSQVLRVASASGTTVDLAVTDLIEEPDFFDTYPEMAQFFARQSKLASLLRDGPVTLDWLDPLGRAGQTVIALQTRRLVSLPGTFWFQMGVGFAALLMASWVFLLRPAYWGTRLFALTGLTFSVATSSAAIYSSRELALPGDVFRALSSINHGGAILFGCALAGLFLMYPKPFVRPRTLLLLPAVFASWWLADALRWAPDQNWGSRLPIALELLMAIVLGLLQWRSSRHQPLDRAALRWFALSSLVGASLFILTMYLPSMLGWFSPLPQAYAFAFFLIMYVGIALGLGRYRLFDLDEWAYRILLWLIGAAAVILMDVALLYVGLDHSVTLGVTLLLCGVLYFPFRQWLWRRLVKRREANIEQLLPEISKITFIVDAAEQEFAWSTLLRQLFNPLDVVSCQSDAKSGEVREDGLVLHVPPCGDISAQNLKYAGHGARLFSSRDAQFATALCHLMEGMMSGRSLYELGVAQERLRIGRDLHDNIGARLLKLIHQLRGSPTAEVARDAMKDLRTAIGALDAHPVPLRDALADWHAEAEGRCESAQCQLVWSQADDISALKLAPRAKASLESVVRELITNALKHASPDCIEVHTYIDPSSSRLSLSVGNNGAVAHPNSWKDGYGLRNMRGRLEELGGSLSIHSGADHVRLTLCVVLA